jgi:hypothetical protein
MWKEGALSNWTFRTRLYFAFLNYRRLEDSARLAQNLRLPITCQQYLRGVGMRLDFSALDKTFESLPFCVSLYLVAERQGKLRK